MKEIVLKDPIHNYIYIEDEVILKLINTKEMQRLRRIKQLGTTNFTFHGAEHSRFTHSVGVYEIARQICENFHRKYPTKMPNDGLWNRKERLITLCAALLHDVGHGAYSHTFEHLFGTDHEKITQAIILDDSTEINQVLQTVSSDFPKKVASVIAKTYPNPQVVQIISSQIDADRMDYLLRDSYFTATKYGMFDLTRLLRIMRPAKQGIVFEQQGMHSVEDYLLSRFQMYQQVYFHHTSRAMEVILHNLLKRAKYLAKNNLFSAEMYPYLLAPLFEPKRWSLADYLKIDDSVLNAYFVLWTNSDDAILRDLAQRFINRQPLKSYQVIRANDPMKAKLLKATKQAGFDPNYYTGTSRCTDLPYDVYQPNNDHPRTQIELLVDEVTEETIELSKASALVAAITGKRMGDECFYYPPEINSK